MLTYTRISVKNGLSTNTILFKRFAAISNQGVMEDEKDGEFRTLNLYKRKNAPVRKKFVKPTVAPPRSKQMAVDQDWGSVWPGPRSFHPATVPLPLHQGFVPKNMAPPGKFANAELMKIPNFLHLTPPTIKKQCEVLKKFCTPWPSGLENDEKIAQHFPIDIITSDYCHALPTIRNPLSRIVSMKMKLSTLNFDDHAKDKFLRLVGDRYNPETDEVTIVTDRCPLRKQNLDYAQYLITALFHESWIKEPWEDTKSEADMEVYIWSRNKSKTTSEAILNWGVSDGKKTPHVEYCQSVETLINEGENIQNLDKYKNEVVKLLNLQNATTA
ncbi:28S ribosomal protein S35, mitochondrial [Pseudolycoriella hygida]|uniref:28S ribosomal protein S35, mitochondrial n=1 Tax=Pseudolycoriella hygida TaxID=35572 RepID=A0A9Q0RU07_9DIPT|nr:28S ribosomal protein S35, mitochondrial [Pseudolycoriella hygida]